MKADRHLTAFQKSCESAIESALALVGAAVVNRELQGERETYIRAAVDGSDLILYIYEDEAQFHTSAGLAGLYESQSYTSWEDLQEAFVSGVVAAFCERLAANNSFKPNPLRGSA